MFTRSGLVFGWLSFSRVLLNDDRPSVHLPV
jgi:hypothetical protein